MTHVRSHIGTLGEKERPSNEKGRAKKRSRSSSVPKGKKVSGGKSVKPKVTQKKNPKQSTVRANLCKFFLEMTRF